MKQCCTCKQDLSSDSFAKSKVEKDGLQRRCTPCRLKYFQTHPLRSLICNAKQRARRKKIPFDLVESELEIPDQCPILGIPILREISKGQTHNSPSIDRIDNAKGYTKNNVQIISWRANDLKRDATPEELQKIADYLVRQQNECK